MGAGSSTESQPLSKNMDSLLYIPCIGLHVKGCAFMSKEKEEFLDGALA